MGFETPEEQCVDEFFRLVSEYGLLCTVRPQAGLTHMNLCLALLDGTVRLLVQAFRCAESMPPYDVCVCPRSVGIMGVTLAGLAGSWC